MIARPRIIELLLTALGADTDYRDAVLGDLAEEFAERAERDGESAARRWYYREAARAAPHLLRDWAHRVRGRDVRHLVQVVFASYFFAMMLVFLFGLMAGSVTQTLGFAPGPRSAFVQAFALTLGVVGTVTGGYIAAWLDGKAPLLSALALGVVWSCGGVVVMAIAGTSDHTWYRICAPVLTLVGATMGGILRVRASRFDSPDLLYQVRSAQ